MEGSFRSHLARVSPNATSWSITYPFTVYSMPCRTDLTESGTMSVNTLGLRQLTRPLPLIKIESAHLNAMSDSSSFEILPTNLEHTYKVSMSADIATSRSSSDVI